MAIDKWSTYYATHKPEKGVTYYKKLLQNARGKAMREGTIRQKEDKVELAKRRFGITEYTQAQFRRITAAGDYSYAEKNRRLASFYEREYKLFTGEYETERASEYIDRLGEQLEFSEKVSQDVMKLWYKYITPDNYYDVADKMPNRNNLFIESNDRGTVGKNADSIEDDIYDAILEGARLTGVDINTPNENWDAEQVADFKRATPIQKLLMKEYDYSIEDARDAVS